MNFDEKYGNSRQGLSMTPYMIFLSVPKSHSKKIFKIKLQNNALSSFLEVFESKRVHLTSENLNPWPHTQTLKKFLHWIWMNHRNGQIGFKNMEFLINQDDNDACIIIIHSEGTKTTCCTKCNQSLRLYSIVKC